MPSMRFWELHWQGGWQICGEKGEKDTGDRKTSKSLVTDDGALDVSNVIFFLRGGHCLYPWLQLTSQLPTHLPTPAQTQPGVRALVLRQKLKYPVETGAWGLVGAERDFASRIPVTGGFWASEQPTAKRVNSRIQNESVHHSQGDCCTLQNARRLSWTNGIWGRWPNPYSHILPSQKIVFR